MGYENKLHYTKPGNDFYEGSLIGNGRLGASILGKPIEDTVILNESSMWSGSPDDNNRMDAARYLPDIRRLLSEGKNYEAEQLFAEHFTCKGQGTAFGAAANAPFGCYQMLGNLHFSFFQSIGHASRSFGNADSYSRDTLLEDGHVQVCFETQGITYKRKYLASAPDQVMAIQYTASKPAEIAFSMSIDRPEHGQSRIINDQTLELYGSLPDGKGGNGISYSCIVQIVTKGGFCYADGNHLCVKGADCAWIYIAAATTMQGFFGRQLTNASAKALEEVTSAAEKGFDAILSAQLTDYRQYDTATSLSLTESNTTSQTTICSQMDLCERIRAFRNGNHDPGLIELYWRYARYLLISSSRPDGMPCNLQGLWAFEIQTPWNGDWHLNAQQELYWLAEDTGLSSLHTPYLRLNQFLAIKGKDTARLYYDADGFCALTCVNPWGFCSPCEDASWGSTLGSPAWQCHHIWEHYLYTCDLDFLREYYPVLRDAAAFYLDVLVEEPEHHYLVTSPSSSPENIFLDEEGRKCSLCMGPTYDTALIRSLFTYCIDAARLLQIADPQTVDLEQALSRMAPFQIDDNGRLMEWLKPYTEALPHHRHISHLWGCYPGYLINAEDTPVLADAVLQSIEARGKTSPGWAIAFRLCIAARLHQDKLCSHLLREAFRFSTTDYLLNLAFHCDETDDNPPYPELSESRHPFQMDGNEGLAEGITMLFLDSRSHFDIDGNRKNEIFLLPAPLPEFPNGSFEGLHARGGFTVSCTWENHTLKKAFIKSLHSQEADVYYKGVKLGAVTPSTGWSYETA